MEKLTFSHETQTNSFKACIEPLTRTASSLAVSGEQNVHVFVVHGCFEVEVGGDVFDPVRR